MKRPIPFGKYLLVERINVGGMAEIFLAKSLGIEGIERRVVIKRILPSMAEDADFTRMFLDEARICVQLNHPNIVQISDLGMHEGSYFIAMEYVPGKDLRSLMEHYQARQEPMPLSEAIYIATRLCDGLDYAHRSTGVNGQPLGIIHRDVSPQNVLLSYTGDIKLIDFGIAKAATNSQRTQAGFLKGKIGYMSPEQIVGMNVDRRADLFAVGIILFEMLTGQRLFTGPTDFAVLAKIRAAEVPSLREINPDIPPALEEVVLRALQAEPSDRYQWCSELEADLQRFLLNPDGSLYTSKHLSASLREVFQEDVESEAERAKRFAEARPPAEDDLAEDGEDEDEDEDEAFEVAPAAGDGEGDEEGEEGDGEEEEDLDDAEGATVAIVGVPFFDDDDEEDEAAAPAAADETPSEEKTPPAPMPAESAALAGEAAIGAHRRFGRSITSEGPARAALSRQPVRSEGEEETPLPEEEGAERATGAPALRSRRSRAELPPRRPRRRASLADQPALDADEGWADQPFADAPAAAEVPSPEDTNPGVAVDPFQEALARPHEDGDLEGEAGADEEGEGDCLEEEGAPDPGATMVMQPPSYEDDDSGQDQEAIHTVYGLQAIDLESPADPGEAAGATAIFSQDMLPKYDGDSEGDVAEEAGATAIFSQDMLPKFADDEDEEEESTRVDPPSRSGRPPPPRRGRGTYGAEIDDGEVDEGEVDEVDEDFEDEEALDAAPSKKGKGLLIALIAAVVLLGVGLGAYVLTRPPAEGELVVTALPSTAGLKLMPPADLPTPLAEARLEIRSGEPLPLPPGTYGLIAQAKGYEDARQQVEVRSGELSELKISLEEIPPPPPPPPPAPKRFTLKVESRPEGAVVELEGKEVGTTPLTLSDIDPAEVKQLELKADGYLSRSETIDWPADGALEVSLSIELEEAPKPKRAAPRPRAAQKAEAIAPAAAKPAPPAVKEDRPPAKAEPKQEQARAAERPAAPAPAKAASAKMGKLIAASKPTGAEISIDGEPTGRKTPVAARKPILVPVGDHIVVFTAPDGKTAIRSISVKENETVKLTGVSDFN